MPYASCVFTGQMQSKEADDCRIRPAEEMIGWMEEAAHEGFAFIRLFAYPNSPAEIDWFWKNKEQYWAKMDQFFALCRKLNLKVIPSLGMYPNAHYRPYTGENNPSILDPTSKTHKLIYAFVAEMVSRYSDDPNILMWEITNEGFLKADIIPAGSKDPKDLMSFAQFQQFYREAAAWIKQHDPNHLVMSGDAAPRLESMANRMKTGTGMDSLREHLSNFLASQPEPLDLMSIHCYGPMKEPSPGRYPHWRTDSEGFRVMPGGLHAGDYTLALVRAAHAADTPLIVGEIGQAHPYLNEDTKAGWLLETLGRLDTEGASLICLWVWRFPEQPHYTFDSQSHPQLVKWSASFNHRHDALRTLGAPLP